jgi:hypothetical protein
VPNQYQVLTQRYADALIRVTEKERDGLRGYELTLMKAAARTKVGAVAIATHQKELAEALRAREELIHTAGKLHDTARILAETTRVAAMNTASAKLEKAGRTRDVKYERDRAKARADYDGEVRKIGQKYDTFARQPHLARALQDYEDVLDALRVTYEDDWEDLYTTQNDANSAALDAEAVALEAANRVENDSIENAKTTHEQKVASVRAALFHQLETAVPTELATYHEACRKLVARCRKEWAELEERYSAAVKKLPKPA